MIWYNSDGTSARTCSWTCTDTDCNKCVGDYCDRYRLTVSTEGAVSDLSPVSDCKYGDAVKLEKVSGASLGVIEIAIVGKSGKLPFIKIYILYIINMIVFFYCTLYII